MADGRPSGPDLSNICTSTDLISQDMSSVDGDSSFDIWSVDQMDFADILPDLSPNYENLGEQNLDKPLLQPILENSDFILEEHWRSKLNTAWSLPYDTPPPVNNNVVAIGNNGSTGVCSSSECFSVGSEALSRTSFVTGIAYPNQPQTEDNSIHNIVAVRPPEKDVEYSIKHLSSCNMVSVSSKNGEAVEMLSESENDDIQSDSIINSKDGTCEIHFQAPKLGLEFSSEEEAYKCYKNYATQIGFIVRKGKIQRLQDGTIRKRYLFCSKQGFRSKNQSDMRRKYKRKETRIGCDAMVQVTRNTNSGKWVISGVNLEHNHDMEAPNQMHISCPSTYISEEDATINTTGLVKEAGNANSAGFPLVDSSSYSCVEKVNVLSPAYGQSLIDFLKHLQLEDPFFFYTVQLDAQSRIMNFFWRDGRSTIDYGYFGDVLILDTTFRISKYDIICAPFLGLNHHQQYVLFGCAFLLDDSMNSYVWLFRTFLEAMGKRQPKTIFTDECQATSGAIEMVLPETQHRLGLWYICRNARKHLSEFYRLPGFEDLFDKFIFHCKSEKEFLSTWDSLLEKYNIQESTWLNTLYVLREKWSHVFSKITFSAGIESFQGSGNITNVFRNMPCESITLSEFVQQYMRAAEQWRKEELYKDFRCNEAKPVLILRSSSLEKQAAEAYTSTMLKLFQEELRGCLSLAIEEIANDGTIITFKLIEEGLEDNIVEFNCLESQISCSCKKFESIGILCVHALKALNARNIFHVPSQYILKRWTKSAKHGMLVDDHKQEITDESQRPLSFITCRLMHKALNVITKSVAVEGNRKIVENHLDMALKEVESVPKT